ncbi:MAG: hypothetical protein ACOYNZ_15380 [Rhodoferax sp.]
MSELDTEVDPIETIYQGEAPSLSQRSMLCYEVGRHTVDGTLHLRIVSNSGGGMWCKDWTSASEIQSIVIGATELTAKSFHPLHSGRSINTGGFVLAALKDLGLIRVNAENTRLHEYVLTTTLEQVAMARIAESKGQVPKSPRRKAKEG